MKRKYLCFCLSGCFIWFICCLVLVAVIYIFTPFVQIEGYSMEPNYSDGEVWVLNKFESIERGDVVVFHQPGKVDLIKRVVAIGGDRVEIDKGSVYLNENLIIEPYLAKGSETIGGSFIMNNQKVTVPLGSFLVLGDNRENSLDSRMQQTGFVEGEWIIGELWFRIFP